MHDVNFLSIQVYYKLHKYKIMVVVLHFIIQEGLNLAEN